MKSSLERNINLEEIDAVIFDMDGVVTETAKIHAEAWKQMFDEFLQKRSARCQEEFKPFDIATDY